MIRSSFAHIPGVGIGTEKKLWKAGVSTWDEFSPCCAGTREGFGRKVLAHISHSKKALKKGHLGWFLERLPASESWRVLRHALTNTAYLDIETTGLYCGPDYITTAALYDGKRLRTYVRGENLKDLPRDLKSYALIVTYNGKTFDLPFIKNDLKVSISVPDVDLRWPCASLDWTGGLKQIEDDLGINRPKALSLLTGFDAPILWNKHKKGHPTALQTLLAYNCADVVSLRTLSQMVFNAKLGRNFKQLKVKVDKPNYNFRHKPDLTLIKQIKKESVYP